MSTPVTLTGRAVSKVARSKPAENGGQHQGDADPWTSEPSRG